MINEYKKGGAFKAYVDKAVHKNNSTPEIECEKVIVKEYYKSLQKGGANENTTRDAVGGDHTNKDSYKPACDC